MNIMVCLFFCVGMNGVLHVHILAWVAGPYQIWEWRLDNDATRLPHIKGEVMDVYKPSQVERYATTPK